MQFPVFEGHFPGEPLVPGAALLRAVERALDGPRFVRLERVRFLAPVQPGEEVEIALQRDGERVHFTARVGDREVLRGVGVTAPPPPL